jgi:hypothetical protein
MMGVRGKKMAVDNSTLERLRCLPVQTCLQALGAYIKVDRSFVPTSALGTLRVHVAVGDQEWELLLDGPKFYDTRTQTGGGGAIDLVMHLWRLPFKPAVKMLVEAGL